MPVISTGSPKSSSQLSLQRAAPLKDGFLRSEHLGAGDLTFLGAGIVFIFAICFIYSRNRILWEDEILGWMLVRDPSWKHMLGAWNLGADGGGFMFYLTARGWFRLFGPSPLSFRFYAASGFCAAFVLSWIAARRFYPLRTVAFAAFSIWFFSPWIVSRMSEGRFYGLLMFCAALTVCATLLANVAPGTSVSLCLALFCSHALLSTSHLLGFVYSFNLLVALVVIDHLTDRWRPLLYLSGAFAWLLLIPERTAIVASATVGKPHFWTRPPTLSHFLAAFVGFSPEILFILATLILLTVWSLQREPRGARATLCAALRERSFLYVTAGALFLVPFEMLVEGWFGPSLFINRYLMPLAIAQIFIVCELLRLIRWSEPPFHHRFSRRNRQYACAAFVLCLLLAVFSPMHTVGVTPIEYATRVTRELPPGVPVICEDARTFIELIAAEHNSGVLYTYLLDWPFSISPQAPRAEVTQYHLMQNWQRAGYFSGSIVPADTFIATHRRFFVLRGGFHLNQVNSPDVSSNPIAERLAQTGAWQAQPFGSANKDGTHDIWLVSRTPADALNHP